MTSGGGVALHLAATSPHLNEAWALLEWAVSPDVQLRECAADTTAPPRKSVLKHACFVDRTRPPRGIDVFLQAPEFVRPDPQAVGWLEAEDLLVELFKPLWDGTKNARQVAQDAVPQVNRTLQPGTR